jgi:hypothetical protein
VTRKPGLARDTACRRIDAKAAGFAAFWEGVIRTMKVSTCQEAVYGM